MDPVAALEFRALIRELQNEGRSILLATHDMAEAQALCRSVTLIDHGRVLLSDRTSAAAQVLGVLIGETRDLVAPGRLQV